MVMPLDLPGDWLASVLMLGRPEQDQLNPLGPFHIRIVTGWNGEEVTFLDVRLSA